MKAIFQHMLTGVKITKAERDIILAADKIFSDIVRTIDKTESKNLDYRVDELYEELTELDLEYFLNNFPIEVEEEE